MRAKLPPHFHSAFEIRTRLKGISLHMATLSLIEFYHAEFEMIFPELNHPLILFKNIKYLGLPSMSSILRETCANGWIVEIYPAVRRLASLLKITFSYPLLQKRLPSSTVYPEIQLACLIVVATKLSHPFDAIPRIPESEADPSSLQVNWQKWREIMADKPSEGLKKGEQMNVTEEAVFTMNEQKLDDYMDWYQRTWIDDDQDSKSKWWSFAYGEKLLIAPVSAPILESFPLSEISPIRSDPPDVEASAVRLKQVQRDLNYIKPILRSLNDTKRPGECYRRYKTIEDIPSLGKDFHELAGMFLLWISTHDDCSNWITAKTVGISVEILVKGVYYIEGRLMEWNLEDRRQELADAEGMLSSDWALPENVQVSGYARGVWSYGV